MGGNFGSANSGFAWFENTQGVEPYVTRHVLDDNGRSSIPYFAVGDFNGDGFDDIAASFSEGLSDTANFAATLGLYMGSDGSANFVDESKARGLEGTCQSFSVLTADFDGDGDLDLFQVCRYGAQNRMLLNDGTGVFSAATLPAFLADAGGDTVYSASLGDVNRDGFPDIYVAGSELTLAVNDGAGSFTDASSTSFPGVTVGTATKCRFYDINGDGCEDAMFVAGLYLNDCDGSDPPTFSDAGAWTNPAPGSPRGIFVGDWDGDGDMDALIPQGFGNLPSTLIYENDGSGSFDGTESPSGWLRENNDISEALLIDLDNDGDLDALIFERCRTCSISKERPIHYAINNKDEPGTTAHVFMLNEPLPAFQKPLPSLLTVTESETGTTRVIATRTESATYGIGAQKRVLIQGLTPDTEYTVSGTSAGTDLAVTFTTPATAQTGTAPIAVTLQAPAGSDCTEDANCLSGKCLGTGVCGAANGEPCESDADCASTRCLHDSNGNICASNDASECAAGSPVVDLFSIRIHGVAYMVTTVEQEGREPDHHLVDFGPVWEVDPVGTHNMILCPNDGE